MWPDFIQFRWLDVADIIFVSVLLYQLYKLVRGTVAISIFTGMLSVYLLWLLVKALKMQLLGTILGQFIGVGAIALIIVFQQELRKFLLLIGTTGFFPRIRSSEGFFRLSEIKNKEDLDINAIVKSCKIMAASNTGAIIVITRKSDLSFFINTGEPIKAKVSQRLIESIFYKNSPLHDGALIIQNNEIVAARCVLPISENSNFPSNLGMRHRAALGIAESTDALALAVSEQSGEISIAYEDHLKLNISLEELKTIIEQELKR
jgi:uncharacterized protein (TIGR00159 family)